MWLSSQKTIECYGRKAFGLQFHRADHSEDIAEFQSFTFNSCNKLSRQRNNRKSDQPECHQEEPYIPR